MKSKLIRAIGAILGSVIAAIVLLVFTAACCSAGLGSGYHPAPWEEEFVD